MLTEVEEYFLKEASNGDLKVRKDGKIINLKTGHSTWAIGSGRYPKISKKDHEAGIIRHIQCHRLVWIFHRGPIPHDQQINHRNGRKEDYRLRNLELQTPKGNMEHAVRTGLHQGRPGVENPLSKFTFEDVREIKKMIAMQIPDKAIAGIFQVSKPTIADIRNGKRYQEV